MPKIVSAKLVFIKFLDHVLYHRTTPLVMKPQERETVGWLFYENQDYIILSWDRDADPPTLKGGDPKASGLVILKKLILEKRECNSSPLFPVMKNFNMTHPKNNS